jgi:hypothetical protein
MEAVSVGFPLYILQDLMQKIKFIKGMKDEPLPCDYFDMVCGTGTGGYALSRRKITLLYLQYIRIIALMIGRLRMSTNECIDAYLKISKTVFGQPQGFTHREKFSPEALKQAIKNIVKRKTGDKNAFLMDPACCKT